MIDLKVTDPVHRAALLQGLSQNGAVPPRPSMDQHIVIDMPSGEPLTGEAAYLVACLRYLLFQSLTELGKHYA